MDLSHDTDATATQTAPGAGPLRSCLYECSVMHHRLSPREHRFQYNIFMFCLDLDELDEVARRTSLFSRNRRNFYSFRDEDHLETACTDVRRQLAHYLSGQDVKLSAKCRVALLTLPRVVGYIFNPVSFYFCFDEQGGPLCAVAEVGNTFRELKLYLLRHETLANGRFRLIVPKHFYVSPFSGLELKFDFKLRIPGETLEIHIDDRDGEKPVLLSALTGTRAPLTNGRLAWFTLKYPLLTLRVMFLIHWHALLLYWKKIPFHRKAANPQLQREVRRPHASLQNGRTDESDPHRQTI